MYLGLLFSYLENMFVYIRTKLFCSSVSKIEGLSSCDCWYFIREQSCYCIIKLAYSRYELMVIVEQWILSDERL